MVLRLFIKMETESKKEIEQKKSLRAKAREHAKKFKRELKKEINTAILAAFGFLIALVWKDVITEFVDNLSEKSPFQGKLVSALIVTFICVIGIMIFAKILKNKEDEKR